MKQSTIICPQCGKTMVRDNTNDFRPFCSQLCKKIDLGNWATGSYLIPKIDEQEADEI
ncbi:MAG: DNA gyrase inhibitor YacG [Nitrosomonadales bacterium]|nr:MAG: DNA gyrase inhibitor YacG [Nitrosomonadales bacterium]